MRKIKETGVPSIGEDIEQLEISYTTGGNGNGKTTLGKKKKQFGRFVNSYIDGYCTRQLFHSQTFTRDK